MSDVTWTEYPTVGGRIYDICWKTNIAPRAEDAKKPNQTEISDMIDSMFQLKMEIVNKVLFGSIQSRRGTKSVKFSCLSLYPKHFTVCQLACNNEHFTIKNVEVCANQWYHMETIDVQNGKNIVLNVHLDLKDIPIESQNVTGKLMNEDLENLLNNEILSDVKLTSTEGNDYKVHKAILAARSDVLRAHFEHNTTECHTHTIDTPFESKVLLEVIKFMYTDIAPNVDEVAAKLLVAADYYQISRLKNVCEFALYKKLTVENAIETFVLADMYTANSLKQSTLQFIKDGPGKTITTTEGWKSLKSIDLMKTIVEYAF